MSTSTHKCPNCGGLFTETAQRFCAFCGIPRPEPERVTVVAPAPNAPERFEAAERHPDLERLIKLEPSSARIAAARGPAALAFSIGVGASILIAFFFYRAGAGAMTAFPLGMAAFCFLLLVVTLARGAEFAAAKLERRIALVADERVLVSGGDNATTRYFATLESKGRERRELRVAAELAGRIAPNDLGVAYVKGDALVDFQRMSV